MQSIGPERQPRGATTLFMSLLLSGVVASGASTQGFAQTVKPADLIGAWARQGETEVIFTFRADSTVMFPVPAQIGTRNVQGTARGRWRLVGDTLLITEVKGRAQGLVVPENFSVDPRLVKLEDDMLILTQLRFTLPDGTPDTSAAARASVTRVYKRVGADTLSTPPAGRP